MKSGFVISVLFLLASCQSPSKGELNSSDTSVMVYRPKGSHKREDWKGATTSYSIYKSTDTFNWKIFLVDTAIGANGRPIFDSVAKTYKFTSGWAELPDSSLKKLERIILPK